MPVSVSLSVTICLYSSLSVFYLYLSVSLSNHSINRPKTGRQLPKIDVDCVSADKEKYHIMKYFIVSYPMVIKLIRQSENMTS